MNLADYIVKKKLTVPQAAAEIGCTRGYLWRLTKRWSRPSQELADAIIAWSRGAVKFDDLMRLDENRPRRRKAA